MAAKPKPQPSDDGRVDQDVERLSGEDDQGRERELGDPARVGGDGRGRRAHESS